jgi:CubicO group peptidase (beta-lactamase class C family)
MRPVRRAAAGGRERRKVTAHASPLRPSALLLAVALSGLASSGCVYARIFYFNTPTLAAVDYFDSRAVHAAPASSPLPHDSAEDRFELSAAERQTYPTFDAMLEANGTRAFLVLKDDRVVYERYFDGTNAGTLLPAFSISKTYAALLFGCAVADHLVGSVDEPLVRYVPEVANKPGYDAITLDELLQMTSGIDMNEESYAGALLYYSTHLPEHTYAYDVKWRPGTHYLYGSVSTQILWDVLSRRLGHETVSRYFEQRLWQPLGAEHDAAWALDSESSGVEKFFSGFSATARDHARLGLLFLHEGRVGGARVVPEAWVRESLEPNPVAGLVHTTDGWVHHGKYQWFLTRDGRAYFAKGFRGQYIFVVPDARMVFVRFGEGYGEVDWTALFLRLAGTPVTTARAAAPLTAGGSPTR